MKPKYDVRIGIEPVSHEAYENFGMICKRHGFSWSADGGCAVAKAHNNLQTLTAETEALTTDLRAAKIKVTRIKIVETILDVEAD